MAQDGPKENKEKAEQAVIGGKSKVVGRYEPITRPNVMNLSSNPAKSNQTATSPELPNIQKKRENVHHKMNKSVEQELSLSRS